MLDILVIYIFMYIILTTMKFYFIIKSLFSIHVFKTLARHSSPSALCVVDIFVVSFSIDMLNVIYR